VTADWRRIAVAGIALVVLVAALTSWITASVVDDDAGSSAVPAAPAGGAGSATGRLAWADVRSFGARGDGKTDDTRAIQRAIDSLKGKPGSPQGGTVYFPRGSYRVDGRLNADRSLSLVLQGDGAPAPGYESLPASVVTYTGEGGDSFLSARSSNGFTVRGLALRYSSKSFTGVLLDFAHAAKDAADSAYVKLEDCLLGGASTTSSAALVSLRQAILVTVRNCHLQWARVGVRGRSKGSDGTGYANAISVEDCTFDNLTTAALANAGEGWAVSHSWFEGTDAGTGGMPRAYYDDLPQGSATTGLSFTGNWFGDAVDVKDAWISTGPATAVYGLEVSGNFFSGGAVAVKIPANAQGVSITGNHLGTSRAAIDLGASVKNGVSITGNSFPPAPAKGILGLTGHKNLRVAGNSGR
jgi:Pectate lyase superfamily protein